MRLTPAVLARAETRLNPAHEREIILRGLRLVAIENLAILQDGFDVLDLSDNEIKKLDNFPQGTSRLSCLMVNNNLVSRVSSTLGSQLRNLTALVLTGNRVTSLIEITHIASLQKLQHLSLLDNPVALNSHYRLYCVHSIPALRSLDYRKISRKEREEASRLFSSEAGRALLLAMMGVGDGPVGVGAARHERNLTGAPALALTDEQKQQVRKAIESAKNREEVDLIESKLRIGAFVFV